MQVILVVRVQVYRVQITQCKLTCTILVQSEEQGAHLRDAQEDAAATGVEVEVDGAALAVDLQRARVRERIETTQHLSAASQSRITSVQLTS